MYLILHIITAIACSQAVVFSLSFRERSEQFLKLCAKLLSNPQSTVGIYCAGREFNGENQEATPLTLEWRRDGSFESPCETPAGQRRWPLRYYRIRLKFQMDIWTSRLGSIPLEAIYFR